MSADILADLARAKAAFQLRALEAIICAQPHQSKPDQELAQPQARDGLEHGRGE